MPRALPLLALLACTSGAGVPLPPAADDAVEVLADVPEGTGWTACEGVAPARLDEVVASNTQGLRDEDGDEVDWLEVALPADAAAADLAGWSLSTDGTPAWTFPGVALAPGDFLVVHASGKDRAEDAAALHASFELDTLGEPLFLHGPGGCVADHVELPRLYADVAYGRDDADAWAYFLEPTPGAANTTESRPGFAGTPTLSPTPGFYDADVVVEATAPPGADALRYTLDGGAPDEDSPRVLEPLDLDAADGPVVVRVRAFQEGLWPGPVATATYAETTAPLDPGLQVISLTVDPEDLWSDERGIYAYGPDYEASYPYFGANFWELWERDLHVEVWGPDGELRIAQDAGIQIAGGYSRAFDQRNFELLARSGYGPDTFAASLFADEDLAAYRRLYLRNGGDWCSTQILDGTVQALLRDAAGRRYDAVDAQAYEPVLVYLNGDFWGLYELKERLDEHWIADHRGADPDALDRVKLGWTHDANWDVEQGDAEAFDALEALVATRDLADDDAWAEFEARVDLENFASAVAAQGWIANTDWWGNNIRMWRPRTNDGRWRWMVYDFGHGWTSSSYDHLATSVSTTSKGMPIGAALANDTFRALLVNVHADYLNTSMSGESAAATVRALAAEVEPAMALQRARWCGGEDLAPWVAAVRVATQFAETRAGVVSSQIVEHLAPGGPVSLSLDADPPGAGTFRLAVVEVEPPFAGTYYRGVPVTVTAVPAGGYAFAGWTDASLGDEASVVLPMAGDATATARFVQAR